MKSHTVHLTMNVPARMDFVNITRDVEKVVADSGVEEGLCLVNAMHITASVFINDDEPGLHEDYKRWLEQLAPFDPSPSRYHHNRTGEDNGDAHHKRQVMGREVVVAVTQGRARLRALGADLLRRVRRPAAQARAGQGDRRVAWRSPKAMKAKPTRIQKRSLPRFSRTNAVPTVVASGTPSALRHRT